MKKLVLIFSLIIICLFDTIKASECSIEDRERLQKLADNVSYILEEVNDNGNISFNVIITGLSTELMITTPNFVTYPGIGVDREITIPNLELGKIYQLQVKGSDKCFYKTYKNIIIRIPNYNPYYNDKLCTNIREYKLCQKWTDDIVPYDEFVEKTNKYIEQIKGETNSNPNVGQDRNKFNFFDLYEKYYWPTFIGMICLLIILIILWVKQNKRNKL